MTLLSEHGRQFLSTEAEHGDLATELGPDDLGLLAALGNGFASIDVLGQDVLGEAILASLAAHELLDVTIVDVDHPLPATPSDDSAIVIDIIGTHGVDEISELVADPLRAVTYVLPSLVAAIVTGAGGPSKGIAGRWPNHKLTIWRNDPARRGDHMNPLCEAVFDDANTYRHWVASFQIAAAPKLIV